MKKVIWALVFILAMLPVVAWAISQSNPAAVNGTLHLVTPATLADKQLSTFLSDSMGDLNVNLAAASVGPLPVTVTFPLNRPVGPDCKLTVTGAVAISTSSCAGGVPATANIAEVCNVGSTVVWSQTATPTTTTGQLFAGGTAAPPSIPVCKRFGPSPNSALTNLKWIEQTGSGTATLYITFEQYQ